MAKFTVNTHRFDPYRNFKFRVKVDNQYVAGLSKCSALKRTTEVTEWREGRSLGVRHTGIVSGAGRFVLGGGRPASTSVTWEESLRFPWWLGGPGAGLVAAPVLRRVWRGNLRRLAALVQNRAHG